MGLFLSKVVYESLCSKFDRETGLRMIEFWWGAKLVQIQKRKKSRHGSMRGASIRNFKS
jgi:hypothetical protein